MAMSTASVTTDTTNYTRIHLILMKGGTLLTKTLFLKRVKDLSPAGHELTVDEFLGQHSVKILSTSTGKNNENKLYPPNGTSTNLDEWDLPLYCFILKTVCDLPMINKLDMGSLKTMRNDLSHLHDPSLTDAHFKNHLSTIEPIFTRSLQMINDPLFEKEMKTLLQRCETGALAVDEIVKIHHHSSRKQIELLSNQMKMMKNQMDVIQNQVVMLQNQTPHKDQMNSALSMLMEIKDRLPSEPDIPDVHVIIEVKNCTKEKEKELLDFLVKQFNETISKPECTLNKDCPNLAMHTISEAIYITLKNFLEKGRHIIKVKNKCIALTIKCNSISSFVCLIRDCMDGKLLDQLKSLTDAVKSWEGCSDVNFEPILSPDEITGAILKLAQNLNEKVPRRDQDAVSLLPKEVSPTIFDVSTSREDTLPPCSTSHILRLTIKPATVDRRKEIEECFSSGSISNRLERLQSELRKDPDFTNVEIKAKLLSSDIQQAESSHTTDVLYARIKYQSQDSTKDNDQEPIKEDGEQFGDCSTSPLASEPPSFREDHTDNETPEKPEILHCEEANELSKPLKVEDENAEESPSRHGTQVQELQYKRPSQHVLEWILSLPDSQNQYDYYDIVRYTSFYFQEERAFDKQLFGIQLKDYENTKEAEIVISSEVLSSGLNADDSAVMDCSDNVASEQTNQELNESECSPKAVESSGVGTEESSLSSYDATQERPEKLPDLPTVKYIDKAPKYQEKLTYIGRSSEISRLSEEYNELSLIVTDVLRDLGVDKETVLRRRNAHLLAGSLQNISYNLQNANNSVHCFGSQSEGTTTIGLSSDIDFLLCMGDYFIIQDLSQWKPGLTNVLMIRDESISPGYCYLQELRYNDPIPITDSCSAHHKQDQRGRTVLKHTVLTRPNILVSGPSTATYLNLNNKCGLAFQCTPLPKEAEVWLQLQAEQGTLTQTMVHYLRKSGFFLVPVGRSGSENQNIEWRISFPDVERLLMFKLKITQLRCYVLMKMIVKTHLTPMDPTRRRISSFICKLILLQSVLKYNHIRWNRLTLIHFLKLNLYRLKECIVNNYCPHFIIQDANLMEDMFTADEKHDLLERLQDILQSRDLGLMAIDIDDLGSNLMRRFNVFDRVYPRRTGARSQSISGILLFENAYLVSKLHNLLLSSSSHCLDKIGTKLLSLLKQGTHVEQRACILLESLIGPSIGCQKVSLNTQKKASVTPECMVWCTIGDRSDVASNRLKLASVFYCSGDFIKAHAILRQTAKEYDARVVIDVCVCHPKTFKKVTSPFLQYAYIYGEYAISKMIAFCVKFLPQEHYCIPKELKYEMFRSTRNDLATRARPDFWMDWAVVDSLPYLYFLQYKICGQLRRINEQKQALKNLEKTIMSEPSLGHLETAMNLLGQCLWLENKDMEAFHCFWISLKIRPRNNVANWHICRLLKSKISASC